GTLTQDFFRIGDAANAAGDTERDVENRSHAPHPAAVDRAAVRARGDVIEHQLIGALRAIALRQLEDVAHDDVVAEAHALDDLTVPYIEARDDAFGKNGRNSSGAILFSSNARPLIAAATPHSDNERKSRAAAIPPEACQCNSGYRRTASEYNGRLGPASVPSRPMSVHNTCVRPTFMKRSMSVHNVAVLVCCQPCVARRGMPLPSRRTSSASTKRRGSNSNIQLITRSGSVTAMLPITARSTPASNSSRMRSIVRSPPPTCSFTPLVLASSSTVGRFGWVPSRAPSRSTMCTRRAPSDR